MTHQTTPPLAGEIEAVKERQAMRTIIREGLAIGEGIRDDVYTDCATLLAALDNTDANLTTAIDLASDYAKKLGNALRENDEAQERIAGLTEALEKIRDEYLSEDSDGVDVMFEIACNALPSPGTKGEG